MCAIQKATVYAHVLCKDSTTNILIFRGKQRWWCPNKTLHQVTRGAYSLILPAHPQHTITLSSIHRKYYTLEPLHPKLDTIIPSCHMLHTASQFFLDLSTPILQLYAYPDSLHCPHALLCLHAPHPCLFHLINMLSQYLFLSCTLQYLSGSLYGLRATVIQPRLLLRIASRYRD